MTTETKYPHTPLKDAARQAVADALQGELHELLDLTLQAKQAHWNVTGPFFRPLHLQLDEMVAEYREWSDDIAERMSAIGVWPRGQARDVASGSGIDPLPDGELKDANVVRLFTDRVATVAARTRERAEALDEADLITQDMLIEIGHGLEKQLWMLRVQLS